MLRWAFKSLMNQRSNLLGGGLGIAGAFILVMFFDAVWRGESVQIVAYPNNVKPDVWVMQRGVGNMHMAMSFLWDWKADQIADMPEVKRVTPILYLNSVIPAGNYEPFAFIVGLLPDAERAGPWEMSGGRKIENPGEAVIPDVLAKLTGVTIGDQFRIVNKTFKVVGLSKGTYSSANAVIFVPFSELEDIISATGTYSYLLVDAEEGVDAEELAEKIRTEIEKVNALPHEEFVKNDLAMANQMGVEIIFMMTAICSALAALIVGFTAYSLVARKRRELAIAKALGMTNASIFYSVILQSNIVTLFGFLLAAAFTLVVIPNLPMLVPQLTLVISITAMAQIGVIALIVSILGALIPAYLMSRLDPAVAFHV